MPPVAVVAVHASLNERLRESWSYPLRGAALATCLVLGLAHWVSLLPAIISIVASLTVWATTVRYAAECLVHTARGFGDPPDVGVEEAAGTGWSLVGIYMWLAVAMLVAFYLAPALLWLGLPLAALLLPASTMALAFDGNVALAINPLHAAQIMARFGRVYLLPVGINALLIALLLIAHAMNQALPGWWVLLGTPLFGFAYSYLVILAFHWMGSLIHRQHEAFGVTLQAEQLATAGGQNADDRLLAEVDHLATTDMQAATLLLVPRLQDRQAPDGLHLAYRDLLTRQRLGDDLLVHCQIWIAAMMVSGQARRALGLVQECVDIDPAFIPDDPGNAGELALLAARCGMRQMALHLSRGYMQAWPQDFSTPSMGLLAAQIWQDTGHHADAAALLAELADDWPDHPLHPELAARAMKLRQPGHLA